MAVDLPALPLTDTFCTDSALEPPPDIDQRLLYCPSCGHGQLENTVAPKVLYGANYSFRTSASATARSGTEFFLSVLDRLEQDRRFRCVLDLGCNDLFLLERLADRATIRVGVDPVWRDREAERDDQDIILFGAGIEELDLKAALPEAPDLIVCRHTLEHLSDPVAVARTLMQVGAEDVLILFEVPGFEALVSRCRFDQVFHQHLHYFSLASLMRLTELAGGTFIGSWENYHDWGAIVVGLIKGNGTSATMAAQPVELSEVKARYELFRRQMDATRAMLEALDAPIYGYGAAQMLPVLAYHMKTDFSALEAILDDDPGKDTLGYSNLPVRVMLREKAGSLAEASVLITAVDNVKPIMTRLLADRPRHILYPFNLI